MTKKLDLYKCEICGNVVEIEHEGSDDLVCCGVEMVHLKEFQANHDNAHFAHTEELENGDKKIFFNHPATMEHHIEFIEAISKDLKYVKKKFLSPEEKPEMILKCDCKEGYYIKLYCNKDGVWVTNK